jgi:hypothetical protein
VPRKPLDVKLLLASLAIAAGIVLVVVGVRASVTGREQQQLPDEIEEIQPVRAATQVPQQSSVFVDLVAEHRAELTVDGVQLEVVDLSELGSATDVTIPAPGEQISLPPVAIFEPGNNTLTYTPAEGGAIERFAPGRHTATVVYWRISEGRESARSYTWDFYVV